MSPNLSRLGAHATGLVLMLVPVLALAWTPYGGGPYPANPGGPDQGAQPMDPSGVPFGYDRGPSGPIGNWVPPFGPPSAEPMDPRRGYTPGGPGGPGDQSAVRAGGLRMNRRATDDAYLLDIQLSGIKPAEVQVQVQGPWVLVTRTSNAQSSQEETDSAGRGYRRSFSYSSGSMSRRFKLPQDADGAALQRQDADDAIQISIPRTKPAAR